MKVVGSNCTLVSSRNRNDIPVKTQSLHDESFATIDQEQHDQKEGDRLRAIALYDLSLRFLSSIHNEDIHEVVRLYIMTLDDYETEVRLKRKKMMDAAISGADDGGTEKNATGGMENESGKGHAATNTSFFGKKCSSAGRVKNFLFCTTKSLKDKVNSNKNTCSNISINNKSHSKEDLKSATNSFSHNKSSNPTISLPNIDHCNDDCNIANTSRESVSESRVNDRSQYDVARTVDPHDPENTEEHLYSDGKRSLGLIEELLHPSSLIPTVTELKKFTSDKNQYLDLYCSHLAKQNLNSNNRCDEREMLWNMQGVFIKPNESESAVGGNTEATSRPGAMEKKGMSSTISKRKLRRAFSGLTNISYPASRARGGSTRNSQQHHTGVVLDDGTNGLTTERLSNYETNHDGRTVSSLDHILQMSGFIPPDLEIENDHASKIATVFEGTENDNINIKDSSKIKNAGKTTVLHESTRMNLSSEFIHLLLQRNNNLSDSGTYNSVNAMQRTILHLACGGIMQAEIDALESLSALKTKVDYYEHTNQYDRATGSAASEEHCANSETKPRELDGTNEQGNSVPCVLPVRNIPQSQNTLIPEDRARAITSNTTQTENHLPPGVGIRGEEAEAAAIARQVEQEDAARKQEQLSRSVRRQNDRLLNKYQVWMKRLASTNSFRNTASKPSQEEANTNHAEKPVSVQQLLSEITQLEQTLENYNASRLQTVKLILTITSSDTISINSVDSRGRTALHYAAELGRESICDFLISTDGSNTQNAILTLIDENGQTPCELAGERKYEHLAAKLEARAVLFGDDTASYTNNTNDAIIGGTNTSSIANEYALAMNDDELNEFLKQQQETNNDAMITTAASSGTMFTAATVNSETTGGIDSIGHPQQMLTAPFSWFQTKTMDDIGVERMSRIKFTRNKLQTILQETAALSFTDSASAKHSHCDIKKVHGNRDDGDANNSTLNKEKAVNEIVIAAGSPKTHSTRCTQNILLTKSEDVTIDRSTLDSITSAHADSIDSVEETIENSKEYSGRINSSRDDVVDDKDIEKMNSSRAVNYDANDGNCAPSLVGVTDKRESHVSMITTDEVSDVKENTEVVLPQTNDDDTATLIRIEGAISDTNDGNGVNIEKKATASISCVARNSLNNGKSKKFPFASFSIKSSSENENVLMTKDEHETVSIEDENGHHLENEIEEDTLNDKLIKKSCSNSQLNMSIPAGNDDDKDAIANKSNNIATPTEAKGIERKSDEELLPSSLTDIQMNQYLEFHLWDVDVAVASYEKDSTKAFSHANVTLYITNYQDSYSDGDRGTISARCKDKQKGHTTQFLGPSLVAEHEVCLICCEEFSSENQSWMSLVNCGHGFCIPCLQEYAIAMAEERLGMRLPCPHHECDHLISEIDFSLLLPPSNNNDDIEVLTIMTQAENEKFVMSASDLKYCPHPGCGGVVQRLTPPHLVTNFDTRCIDFCSASCTMINGSDFGDPMAPITYDGVSDFAYHDLNMGREPYRAHRFCFTCGGDPHFPATCDNIHDWKIKVDEEIDSTNESEEGKEERFEDIAHRLWIKANTKPCPQCKAPIEKNDGCNHMICSNRSCRHEFCWICRKDWKLHNTKTGGFFRCNRWQEDEEDEKMPTSSNRDRHSFGTSLQSSRDARKKSRAMARFLHHYSRWTAHEDSAKLEKNMADTVTSRLHKVVIAGKAFGQNRLENENKGLSFVHAAFTELLECRAFLRHSYTFAYFRYPTSSSAISRIIRSSKDREQLSFEAEQSELEMITEQMSDIVARSHLRATQGQIIFLTHAAADKRRAMSNLIITILHEERRIAEKKDKFAKRRTPDSDNDTHSPIQSVSNDSSEPDHGLSVELREMMARMAHVLDLDIGEDTDSENEHVGDDVEFLPENIGDDFEQAVQASIRSHALDEAFLNESDDDEDAVHLLEEWVCPGCTYINRGGSRCAMCGTRNA
eukprot:CAMPEP_0194369118 /NCGR_PEP_ID=MMETSP0174-20130528/17376_1 /TAXON_ID=216777 /ORGANISM="Proboscia alata, Strain PI-D3" /LENGTH=1950 /DNA_ID=CAMNT_0039145855 /DNA_START=160 /DNA_END=6012 /DNA_ORIENTATION=+